jgi:putative ABC transport system permease protein
MIKNYFKVALRNVLKHKFFSFINILGLTIGMTSCLFIFIYVTDELSYDQFHRNPENIYRVGLHGIIGTQDINVSSTSYPLAAAMQTTIPGVEQTVRLWPRLQGMVVKNGTKAFTERTLYFADSTFFQFFDFELVQGDAATVLKEPNSIVLTEETALKYFDQEDPIGKTLVIGSDNRSYKVTGIAKAAPANSHLKFNALMSFSSVDKDIYHGWSGNSLQTYIRKTPATSIESVNTKLDELVEKYVGPELEQGLGISFADFKKNGGAYAYYIFPMTDTHLKSSHIQDDYQKSDIKYVYIFAIVGGFLLVIACINFMNLSTARSAGRAKEVGLRKTMGSARAPLMFQFLSESLLYGLVAVLLSVALCYLLLPYFNLLSGKLLTFQSLNNVYFGVGAILLILIVGLLAGSYPAFYLTAFNATEVLKGKVRSGMKSKGIRSSLVVVQFAISIFLIICTAVVFNQLDYLQSRNLGMDKQNVITLQHLTKLGSNQEPFKKELLQLSGISGASFTNNRLPGQENTTVFREKGSDKDYLFETFYVDHDYASVLKLELLEGRFFTNATQADTLSIIVNEAAVKEFGWHENILSREVLNFNGEKPVTMKVIGVVKDFAFESLKDKVRPLILQYSPKLRFLMVRYEGDPQQVVASIQGVWTRLANGEPFEYSFLDQNFDALFHSEKRLKNLATVFTGLAILVACLGLFALAAFTTEQRTKEIGIRKALGASTTGLTMILSREFTILVIISFVPAAAAAWYLSGFWLNGFAYRTEVSIWLFVLGGLLSLGVAWLTVAFQAFKAARTNPVNSLRYE